jgi:hypothetical protein
MVSNTGARSVGELEMMPRTSDIAVCCSKSSGVRSPDRLLAHAHIHPHWRTRMTRGLEMDRVAPVLDFIKQDINQGNGAAGWVDRAKVAGFSDEDISLAMKWLAI